MMKLLSGTPTRTGPVDQYRRNGISAESALAKHVIVRCGATVKLGI